MSKFDTLGRSSRITMVFNGENCDGETEVPAAAQYAIG